MADRSLDVRLRVLNSRAFLAETRKAATGVSTLGKTTRSVGSTMRRAVGGAVALGTAYLGISQAQDAVQTTQDLSKATLALNRNLGLSAQTASSWAAVATARGVDTDSLNTSFTALSKNLVKSTDEASTSAKAFKKLGFTQKDLAKGRKNFNFLIGKTAAGLGSMKGGAERAALAQQLLGRSAQTSLPIFTAGRKSLRENLKMAEKYGVTLEGDTLESLKELNEAQKEWEFAQLGMKVAFTRYTAPALTEMAKLGADLQVIFADDSLSLDEKFEEAGQRIDRLHLGEHLADAFEAAFPVMAEAAGRGSGLVVRSFVRGWWDAGIGGKLFTLGLLASKVGVFSSLGGMASKRFITRFAPRLAAALGIEMAAEGAIGKAVMGGSAIGPGAGRWGKFGSAAGRAFATGFTAFALVELGLHRTEIQDFLKDTFDIGPGGSHKPSEKAQEGQPPTTWEKLKEQFIGGIPGLAAGGTVTRGGLTWVGEAGPELVRLPKAASVTPLSGGGGAAAVTVIDRTVHKLVMPNGKEIAVAVGRAKSDREARV